MTDNLKQFIFNNLIKDLSNVEIHVLHIVF